MRRGLLGGVLAIATALLVADVASAQLFRRGRGGSYGSGYYGNGYYGNGYYGNGYYGNGSYGNGSYGPGGSGNYGYGNNWNNPANTYGSGNTQGWNDGNYRSFYPPNNNDSQFNQQDDRFGNQQGNNQQGQAFIMIRVPSPDAQVWFDDHRTQQGGTQRFFESPPLQSGSKYSYHIKAKWRDNGKDIEKTRTVRVQPGQRVMVDFDQSSNQQGERLNQPNRADQSNRNNQSNQNQSDQNQSNRNQSNQNPPRQNQDQNPPQQDQ